MYEKLEIQWRYMTGPQDWNDIPLKMKIECDYMGMVEVSIKAMANAEHVRDVRVKWNDRYYIFRGDLTWIRESAYGNNHSR